MKRFNMNIPESELEDIQRIADDSGTSVVAVIRAYCKLGIELSKRQEQGVKIILKHPSGTEIEFFWI